MEPYNGRSPTVTDNLVMLDERGAAQCSSRTEKGTGNELTDRFLSWLAKAYSSELRRAQRLDLDAESPNLESLLRMRTSSHAAQIRRHAARLQDCIKRISQGQWTCRPHGKAKASAGAFSASGPAREDASGPAEISDIWGTPLWECGEIMMYTMLMTAANALGFQETVRICRDIIEEEKQFNDWLTEHLAEQVRREFRNR